jgi:hypothetical protein
MKLPEELKTVFWNYDTTFMDTDRMKKIIILEVLARGSLEQIKILFSIYGSETVADIFREDVKGPRTLPAPTVYLWGDIFLTGEEFEEYKQWHRHLVRKWEQRRVITLPDS